MCKPVKQHLHGCIKVSNDQLNILKKIMFHIILTSSIIHIVRYVFLFVDTFYLVINSNFHQLILSYYMLDFVIKVFSFSLYYIQIYVENMKFYLQNRLVTLFQNITGTNNLAFLFLPIF